MNRRDADSSIDHHTASFSHGLFTALVLAALVIAVLRLAGVVDVHW